MRACGKVGSETRSWRAKRAISYITKVYGGGDALVEKLKTPSAVL